MSLLLAGDTAIWLVLGVLLVVAAAALVSRRGSAHAAPDEVPGEVPPGGAHRAEPPEVEVQAEAAEDVEAVDVAEDAGGYAGSAAPTADGTPPVGHPIKGNESSMLFHTYESPYYARTRADVWFDTEESARAAGFSRWDER